MEYFHYIDMHKVSELARRHFVDLDNIIEYKIGMTKREIDRFYSRGVIEDNQAKLLSSYLMVDIGDIINYNIEMREITKELEERIKETHNCSYRKISEDVRVAREAILKIGQGIRIFKEGDNTGADKTTRKQSKAICIER